MKLFIEFGYCVLTLLKNNFSKVIFVLLFSTYSLASQKATVVHEAAVVFKDADFDSAQIAEVKGGEVYEISNLKKGIFYKIRLKDGQLGYIADNEVRPGVLNKAKKQSQSNQKENQNGNIKSNTVGNKNSSKPFITKRYRGPKIEMVNFTEDTMGKTANETLGFLGLNVAGQNTMFAGETYADANLLFYSGAPSYYKKATGNAASGYILLANFSLETTIPMAKTYMFFYGFGLGLRMSHFDVTLNETSRSVSYALDDITIGALLNSGVAFQTGASSIRLDLKYYLEKKFYPALGLSWVFQF